MDGISVFAPATVGNTGPCYDVIGYALDYVGDFVTLEKVKQTDDEVIWDGVDGPHAESLRNVEYHDNCAWVVANSIWKEFVDYASLDFSLRLRLHKYMPVGSGLGSSAASSVAAAAAIVRLLALKIADDKLVPFLELGEEVSSGTGYPDNVVPSYFGGLYVIFEERDPDRPTVVRESRYTRIGGGDSIISVLVCPEKEVTTCESRDAVRDYIREEYLNSGCEPADILKIMREQSAKSAELVHAFMTDDVQQVGNILNNNPILEAARSKFIPYFDEAKAAALQAGAYGCTIAGSGPAIVAITDEQERAGHIRDAIVRAFKGLKAQWLISPVGKSGARPVGSVDEFVTQSAAYHNFY